MSAAVPTPDVAVVIPSVNGLSMLVECLEALEGQASGDDVEVVVADRCGEDLRTQLADKFPWVIVLAGRDDESIPELRDRGIRQCRAPLVAIIEDHCLVTEGWMAQIREAYAELPDDFAAVGGPVENGAVDRLVDWAAFLCEYSHAMGPHPAGEAAGLPGNNVVYKREALELLVPERAEMWEYFLHAKLREAGHRFYFRPSMIVLHKRPFGVLEYLQQRFLYSRSFAAMRSAGTSGGKRWVLAAMSLALPPVLLWRISRRVLKGRRHVGKLIVSLPLISVFTVSWAAGEIVGHVSGAGHSLQKVT